LDCAEDGRLCSWRCHARSRSTATRLRSTGACRPTRPRSGSALSGLRIGAGSRAFRRGALAEVEQAVREAVRVYRVPRREGQELSLPHGKYAVHLLHHRPSEASSNLARYDGVHYGYAHDTNWRCRPNLRPSASNSSGLAPARRRRRRTDQRPGPHVSPHSGGRFRRRSETPRHAGHVRLSAGYYDAYYLKASRCGADPPGFRRRLREVDLIAGARGPTLGFRLGERVDDPLATVPLTIFTRLSTNLARDRRISIPCGLSSEGMPIGLHLQSPPFEESGCCAGRDVSSRPRDWHTKRPKLDD